jgi:hypothetical protein
MSPAFSVRPDGVLTLEELIRKIPQYYRSKIEDDFNGLFQAGWGELTFTVERGEITGHLVTLSRKHTQSNRKK